MTARDRMTQQEPRVVVLGGINLDTSHRVADFPAPGETVLADMTLKGLGGKGANQAVAIARTGTAVVLLGVVGQDAAATQLVAVLEDAGVDVGRLGHVADVETGSATIVVDRHGQNFVVVSPAANRELGAEYAATVSDVISAADVLLVQGEVAPEASAAAARLAAVGGARVIVNLAPIVDLGPELGLADPLVVNEVEASQMLGARIVSAADAVEHGTRLLERCRSAVITVGREGAVVIEGGAVAHVPAPIPSRVVDTTGAGDAFVGVLAAALAAGQGLHEAVVAATSAATLSVEYGGSAEGYPVFPQLRGERAGADR